MYRPSVHEEDDGALLAAAQVAWNLPQATSKKLANGVYQLCQQGRFYVLKRITFPLPEFAYISGALRHLAVQGANNVAPPLVTVDGTEALLYAERYYALTQWLPGEAADFGKAEQVERVGASLAQLHQTSCGYRPYFYQGRIKWGQTLLIFRRKQKEMVAFAKRAKVATPPDLCDLLYCRGVSVALANGEQAFRLLQPIYGSLNAIAQQKSGFCHHDLCCHNLLLPPYGGVNFIDFDYCISDSFCHDIASLLKRILKANNWQIPLACQALAAYENISPLSDIEKQAVAAWLLFPQDFWQAGFAYYSEGWVPREKIARRLSLWEEQQDLRQEAYRNLFQAWHITNIE